MENLQQSENIGEPEPNLISQIPNGHKKIPWKIIFMFISTLSIIAGIPIVLATFKLQNPNKVDQSNTTQIETGVEENTTKNLEINNEKYPVEISKTPSLQPPKTTPPPSVTPKIPKIDLAAQPSYIVVTREIDDWSEKGIKYESGPTFEEVVSVWKTTVKACFVMSGSQPVSKNTIEFKLIQDGQETAYQPTSALVAVPVSMYGWCHVSPNSVGSHLLKVILNPNRKIEEDNYSNNELSIKYEIRPDAAPPAFTIFGPHTEIEGTCFHLNDVSDNVSLFNELKIYQKFDNQSWQDQSSSRICISGQSGDQHSYTAKVVDARGNSEEKTKAFTLP